MSEATSAAGAAVVAVNDGQVSPIDSLPRYPSITFDQEDRDVLVSELSLEEVRKILERTKPQRGFYDPRDGARSHAPNESETIKIHNTRLAVFQLLQQKYSVTLGKQDYADIFQSCELMRLGLGLVRTALPYDIKDVGVSISPAIAKLDVKTINAATVQLEDMTKAIKNSAAYQNAPAEAINPPALRRHSALGLADGNRRSPTPAPWVRLSPGHQTAVSNMLPTEFNLTSQQRAASPVSGAAAASQRPRLPADLLADIAKMGSGNCKQKVILQRGSQIKHVRSQSGGSEHGGF